jgi:hypothetical protein
MLSNSQGPILRQVKEKYKRQALAPETGNFKGGL